MSQVSVTTLISNSSRSLKIPCCCWPGRRSIPTSRPQYQTYYDQGFELARRLQDAEALQAYREEDWFQAQQLTSHIMGDQIANLGDPSQLDMIDVLQRMAREAFWHGCAPRSNCPDAA